MDDAAQAAAQDQSDAALRDAVLAEGLAMARVFGETTLSAREQPYDTLVRERFLAWLRGTPLQCPHDPFETQPAVHWLAWRPALMCVPCVNADQRRIEGTPEDRRCDICGIIQPEGPEVISARTVVLQISPRPGLIPPPFLLHYGACPACEEHEGKPAADTDAIKDGDTVSWINRHGMRSWGLAEYRTGDSVHVRVPGLGTQKMRYAIKLAKIDKHWPGRAEYDRHQ